MNLLLVGLNIVNHYTNKSENYDKNNATTKNGMVYAFIQK